MTSPSEFRGSVVAIDWSGAKARRAQTEGIALAIIRESGSLECSTGRTRDETIDYVLACEAPVVVGFDFSFGFPAWFASEHGCRTIDDVWELANREGEAWLRATPPFWRERCDVPAEQRFRRCEERLRAQGFPAKSIFQLVGNGQVGAGSVRGMPLLARLRANGFTIWPFEHASDRTAFEIYPSRLRRAGRDGSDEPSYASPHVRDAAESALVMWEHRASFAALTATTDPITRIEGDVWTPC